MILSNLLIVQLCQSLVFLGFLSRKLEQRLFLLLDLRNLKLTKDYICLCLSSLSPYHAHTQTHTCPASKVNVWTFPIYNVNFKLIIKPIITVLDVFIGHTNMLKTSTNVLFNISLKSNSLCFIMSVVVHYLGETHFVAGYILHMT